MTDPIAAPCHIYHTNGHTFVVKDINAWCFDDQIVQADGYWADDPARHEKDVLIPLSSIDHIVVDYAALDAYVAAQAADNDSTTEEVTA